MGTWGYQPWENDAAADWFGSTWDACAFPVFVDEALRLDVRFHFEEVRAAAFVVLCLGQTMLWPMEMHDDHLHLALKQLKKMIRICESKEITATIKKEVAVLEKRINEIKKRRRGRST